MMTGSGFSALVLGVFGKSPFLQGSGRPLVSGTRAVGKMLSQTGHCCTALLTQQSLIGTAWQHAAPSLCFHQSVMARQTAALSAVHIILSQLGTDMLLLHHLQELAPGDHLQTRETLRMSIPRQQQASSFWGPQPQQCTPPPSPTSQPQILERCQTTTPFPAQQTMLQLLSKLDLHHPGHLYQARPSLRLFSAARTRHQPPQHRSQQRRRR